MHGHMYACVRGPKMACVIARRSCACMAVCVQMCARMAVPQSCPAVVGLGLGLGLALGLGLGLGLPLLELTLGPGLGLGLELLLPPPGMTAGVPTAASLYLDSQPAMAALDRGLIRLLAMLIVLVTRPALLV